ncbi:hypothetical protein [Actinotalea ferrariae]|nr:hypothetical protein [Actinotalea ferrariae]
MPALSPEQLDALRRDIADRGVVVPVVIDQHGRVLDGHNRSRIAAGLGIECPTETRYVRDDDEAADLAVTLNCARRHLNREQVRHVVRAELDRRPGDSDRAIARRVGCSPSTVGAIRRGQVSNLDTTMSAAEAADRTAEIRTALKSATEGLLALVIEAMTNNISVDSIVTALTTAHRSIVREGRDEHDVIRRYVYDPVIDYVLDPDVQAAWRAQWDHETFQPLQEHERSHLLLALAGGGPRG